MSAEAGSASVEIDAVLLDFGGVFTLSPFDALRSLADDLEIDFDVAMDLVFGPYDRDTDHPWHRVERGELGIEECRATVRAEATRLGHDIDLYMVLERMGSAGGVRDDVVEHVRVIRSQGHRTALVTNNAAEFRPLWRPLLPLDELFDVVVDSSEVGIRKPDPQIYQHTLRALGGVAPERAVFVDDFEGNVAAARDIGMHGIVVGSEHEPAFEELGRLLAR